VRECEKEKEHEIEREREMVRGRLRQRFSLKRLIKKYVFIVRCFNRGSWVAGRGYM
jgi:hypothetical protein